MNDKLLTNLFFFFLIMNKTLEPLKIFIIFYSLLNKKGL